MRHVDRERVRTAKLIGSAHRLRDLVMTQPQRYAAMRDSWPDLAERIDSVAELADWEHPDNG